MPYIKIESGALTDEQKTLLIKRLTEVSSEIMHIPQEFFTTREDIIYRNKTLVEFVRIDT